MVLVIGFVDSVHTARWIRSASGRGARFVVVPTYRAQPCPEMGRAPKVAEPGDLASMAEGEIGVFDLDSVSPAEMAMVQDRIRYEPWRPSFLAEAPFAHPAHVAAAVRRLRPVAVHSMVVQFGGYLGLAAREYLGDRFPPWLLSNWGSDIYLYRRLADHHARIKRLLALIDGYHAECERDVRMAREMGFRGFAFPALPASGGMDFDGFPALDRFARTSSRREILIKGYHGWAGRGLHILQALHLAAADLRGYKIRITLAGDSLRAVSAELERTHGLDIAIEPYLASHEDALNRLAEARAVVGFGISDGISTTLLEAMAVGTLPIQSCSSCGNEWVEPGRTGLLVPHYDVAGLAAAIRRAVTEDALVDEAAPANRRVVEARWNAAVNGPRILECYLAMARASSANHPAVEDAMHG